MRLPREVRLNKFQIKFFKEENIMANGDDKEKKDEKEKNSTGDKLISEGCKAYGIDKKHVMSAKYDEAAETAIILTNGGTRVRFKAGDKVEPLGDIAITGIPKPRKVIAGKEKK